MNRISYVYVVHSKVDEENIYNEFETLTEAIEYAKEYIDKQTYVEQVEVEINDFGEVVDSGEPELAWSYEGEEAADHEVDEDITAEEEAELDADYQAMAEAEHPIDEVVQPKKDIETRLEELEARLNEAECKDYKVITHSEDEVKDLKESLLHEGVSAEAVAVVSELLEDEWEAISGYEDAVAKLEKLDVEDKEKVLHVLDHISEEESIHVGQLEQIVKLLNPEHIAKQDEGHEEGAEELAGEDPHEEVSVGEESEEEPVEESLTEDVDEDYKAALKKALPLLKKDGVFGVVLGYDQGKGYIYLDKPLVKKSAKELAEYQKSFSTGKQAVKATIRTVYPNQIAEIEELLGIEPMSEAVAIDEYDIRNVRGHFEIYKGTEFVGAADTEAEAEKEVEKLQSVVEEIDYNKLREELEENEDEVECQHCFETFAKEDCVKGEHGYLCKKCFEAFNNSSYKKYHKTVADIIDVKGDKVALNTVIEISNPVSNKQLFITPVNVQHNKETNQTNKVKWGTGHGYNDCKLFFNNINTAEAFIKAAEKANIIPTEFHNKLKAAEATFHANEYISVGTDLGKVYIAAGRFDSEDEAIENVECQHCFETFAKEDCIKGEHGYICKNCAKLQENLGQPKIGDTIRIIDMADEPDYTGRTGIIRWIDDLGQLHGTWGGLAVIPEEDEFELVDSEDLTEAVAPLDFFIRVVKAHSRDRDFLSRALDDIDYIDEVAPGLYSIDSLSLQDLDKLKSFIEAKAKAINIF